MPPANSLPTELWLIIFESLVAISTSPSEYSNSNNFPEVSRHLRSPWDQPLVKNTRLYNLRLVSRSFKALFERVMPSFNHHFFEKSALCDIPAGKKALYVSQDVDILHYLPRLISKPATCHQICTLDIYNTSKQNRLEESTFDILCNNASDFPLLQTLSLEPPRTTTGGPFSNFWFRLNDAFPQLTCLVVRQWVPSYEGDTDLTFGRLEVLDVNGAPPDSRLHFPSLKHAAFGCVSSSELASFNGRSRLESLLLKEIVEAHHFSWDLFPNLQLIGIPGRRAETFGPLPPLPAHHPLRHIYIYLGVTFHSGRGSDRITQYEWLSRMVGHLPAVSRITLAVETSAKHHQPWVSMDYDQETLRRLGLSVNKIASRQIKGTRLVVLQRTSSPSTGLDWYHNYSASLVNPSLHTPAVSQAQGKGERWKRFQDFASRKLGSVY